MSKTVLILGAGVGGLAAANLLRRSLPKGSRVVVADRERSVSFAASYLWVMSGERRAEQLSPPLDRLRRKGIELIEGEIERIDPNKREATIGGASISADYLIVALGADFVPETVPGLVEGGLTFTTLAGAAQLRAALAAFTEGRVVVLTAAPLYKCPAAPYEAAMLIEAGFRRRGIRKQVTVELYAAEPGPMGVAGPAVSAAVRGMVEAQGIGYFPDHQVTKVDPIGRSVEFANGKRAGYDLLVYMPPVRAPQVVRESGLVDKSGWVAVDRNTLATRFAAVYALGDVATIPLSMGKPLPKAGVFARAQAEVVARNIARIVSGRGRAASFDGHGACFVEVGAGKAGFGAGNFYGEPVPTVNMRRPSWYWHVGKVLYEKYWFWRWP